MHSYIPRPGAEWSVEFEYPWGPEDKFGRGEWKARYNACYPLEEAIKSLRLALRHESVYNWRLRNVLTEETIPAEAFGL